MQLSMQLLAIQTDYHMLQKDIVYHFETRQEIFEGKVMILGMTRQICVDLSAQIIKLKPERHLEDKVKGVIKIIMTSSYDDLESSQPFLLIILALHHSSLVEIDKTYVINNEIWTNSGLILKTKNPN
jgi:hypothetical protein